MPLNDIDRYVKAGRYAAALEAIERVRKNEPQNPYTAAYEVRVRSLLEEAKREKQSQEAGRRLVAGNRYDPSERTLPSVEQQINSIASPLPPTGEPEKHRELSTEMQRLAVLSKIADLLSNATECLSRSEYQPALDALERASLLDPSNSDIVALEARIRVAQQEAISLTRKASARAASLEEILEEARLAAAKGDFSEALRSVTTASILDPDHPDVIRCEEEIRRMQAEQSRAAEEQEKAEAERQNASAKRNVLEAEISAAEQERRHARALVAKHVARARSLLAAGEFGHALVEIDHAFLINPLDEEVRNLQAEISAAQSPAQLPDAARAKSSMIASYLAEAQRLKAQGKNADALGAVSRVLILDPTNDEARAIERRLQAEIARSTPFQGEAIVHPHAFPQPFRTYVDSSFDDDEPAAPGPSDSDQESSHPHKRRRTYLLAASFLATTVVALLMVTQVLSRADSSTVQPDPVFPMNEGGTEEVSVASRLPQTGSTAGLLIPPAMPKARGRARRSEQNDTATAQASASTDPVTEVLPGVRRLEYPDLPDEALGSDRDERVTVKVQVDSTGRPLQAVILMSTNEKFNQPVADAVMRSTYSPWSEPGKRATRWLTIPLSFTR